jgi:CubicO group peptidase (beta-lactamase class C family)
MKAALLLLIPFALPHAEPRVDGRVDALFAPWDKEGSPGAAVAVMKDGEIIVADGYGNAQIEYGVPITPETVFHVASVSKQFTAFAVCLLADEGKLALDDPVQKYIPEVPDFGRTITLKHLLHHTSGLRDQWEALQIAGWRMDDVITTQHVLTMVSHQRELNFEPGAEYMYCNTGYTLLAETVARVSGQSFPEFCREQIFEPLGMEQTHFHDDHERIVPERAYSYAHRDDGFQNAVLSFANAGATSLFTTAIDLLFWLANFGTGELGGPEVQTMMRETYVLSDGTAGTYALGIMLGESGGHRTISHSGGDAGFRSFVAWYPDQELGVVVLANLGSIQTASLASRVAGFYLDEPPPRAASNGGGPSSASPPPAPEETPEPRTLVLADYPGRYWSEELGTFYDLVVEDDALTAHHRRHGTIQLTPDGNDAFRGNRILQGRLEFSRDAEGLVESFRYQGGRVRNIYFERRQ